MSVLSPIIMNQGARGVRVFDYFATIKHRVEKMTIILNRTNNLKIDLRVSDNLKKQVYEQIADIHDIEVNKSIDINYLHRYSMMFSIGNAEFANITHPEEIDWLLIYDYGMIDNPINFGDFSNYSKKIKRIEIFSDSVYTISNLPETVETLILNGDNFIIKPLPKGLKVLEMTKKCSDNNPDLEIPHGLEKLIIY